MSNNTVADVVLKDMRNRIGRFACTCYCGGFGSQMVLLSDIDRVLGEFATPPTPTPTSSPSREWLTRMAEAEAQCPSVTAGVPDAATAELERVTKERDSARAEVERVRGDTIALTHALQAWTTSEGPHTKACQEGGDTRCSACIAFECRDAVTNEAKAAMQRAIDFEESALAPTPQAQQTTGDAAREPKP